MAIITPAQVREHYAKLTGTAEDTILTTLITRADAQLAAWCGFPKPDSTDHTFEDQTYTRYFDGPDILEPKRVSLLDVPPVVSVTSVATDSAGDWSYATTISSTYYTLFANQRELWLKPTAPYAWQSTPKGNKVVVVAGWTTAPPNLVQAVAMQVHHLLSLRHSQGLQSINAGGQSATKAFNPDQGGADFAVPPLVQAQLRDFRLVGSYCG